MPELPEIYSRAKELKLELSGRVITGVDIIQSKSLNIPEEEFISKLTGAVIEDVTPRGKWILIKTDAGWLLINLGMGGEILLFKQGDYPEKTRLTINFDDHRFLSINFWWFGYVHYTPKDGLEQHKMTARLGVDALEITRENFHKILESRKSRIKSFLLDQSKIAGIGNAYIHDILWFARLHPLRATNTMDTDDIERLFDAVHQGLEPSLNKRGAFYELDIYGNPGGFNSDDIKIGYREGEPCPRCSSKIMKIKTGSTSSYICPSCQSY
ncbi:MAG: Fpg/Nei family DNA glycosylase [Anaerolineales bacterium]|jgi:formamidopyrimidine-DNA glycosylase